MKIIILCLVGVAFMEVATAFNNATTYRIVRTMVTPYEAEKRCLVLGGKIADIEDEETALAVQDYINTTPDLPDNERSIRFWIGRNDIVEEGFWVDSNGRRSSNYGWCFDAPDDWATGQDCGCYEMYTPCMNDWPCDINLYFLCAFQENNCT